MARHNRPRFNPAVLPAYGRLMSTRPKPGDTLTLKGRKVAVLDVITSTLCRVRFEDGRTATVHLDLLTPKH